MNTTSMHERASAFDELAAPHGQHSPLITLDHSATAALMSHDEVAAIDALDQPWPQAPTPPAPLTVDVPEQRRSTVYSGRIVSDWVRGLDVDHGLVDPQDVRINRYGAHLHFDDQAALQTAIAYAEQLDAQVPVDVVLDIVGDVVGITIYGAVLGVPVSLHVDTRARLAPASVFVLADLRRHIEGDRATRALDVVPTAAAEPVGQQDEVEQ